MSWYDYENAKNLLEQHKNKCELNAEQSETDFPNCQRLQIVCQ